VGKTINEPSARCAYASTLPATGGATMRLSHVVRQSARLVGAKVETNEPVLL
jgi:hypothetical protein